MNWKRKLKNIDSFLPIKTSLKYWDRLLAHLFDYDFRSYGCELELKLIKNHSRKITLFEKKYGYLTPGRSLIGKVTEAEEDVEIVNAILLAIAGAFEDPYLAQMASVEVITKVLAYRNLQEGMNIPIHHLVRGNSSPLLMTYKVDLVFDLWKEMKAFGLVDREGKEGPILLFRGTDFSLMSKGSRASIITDLDPRGPGRFLYRHIKEPIKTWLEEVTTKKKKARVMGFSLGGSLASFTLLSNTKYFSRDALLPSYLFHSPGLPSDLFRRWKALKHKPHVEFFVAKGDPVSKLGKLFGNAQELSVEEKLGPIAAHTQLYFLKSKSQLGSVLVDEENLCSHRKEFSKIHRKMSYLLYKLGLKHLMPVNKSRK